MRCLWLAILVCLGIEGAAFADALPACHQPLCHQPARGVDWPEVRHKRSDMQRVVLSSFSLAIPDQWERMEVSPFYSLAVNYRPGRRLLLEVDSGEEWLLPQGSSAAEITTAADQIRHAFSATPGDLDTLSGALQKALRRAMAFKSLLAGDASALAFMRSTPYVAYWAVASHPLAPDRMFVTNSGSPDEFLRITAIGFGGDELRAVVGSLLQGEGQ